MERTKYVLFMKFLPFTFLPSPCHYIFPRSEVAFSWKVTFARGQADGGSHRQAQFSSPTMCHSEALKISVLETPGLLLNVGHWQHKALLKAPVCDTGPARTTPHPRGTAMSQSVLCNCNNLGFRGFFIIISCSNPEVLVSLARVSSQRQAQYQKASDLPSALP